MIYQSAPRGDWSAIGSATTSTSSSTGGTSAATQTSGVGSGAVTGTGSSNSTTTFAVTATGTARASQSSSSTSGASSACDAGPCVTTFAGTGPPGQGGDTFEGPSGVAVDPAGTVYVGDLGNERVAKIDRAGNVTTLAGDGGVGDSVGQAGTTKFNSPWGVAVDSAGNVYVADSYNGRIKKIDLAGNVTVFAGNGKAGFADGTGGPNGTAMFATPTGIAVDPAGNLLVADTSNNRIRKIDPSGNVTTVAGNGALGFVDGTGGTNGTASFTDPEGVAADTDGTLYVADTFSFSIRRIDASGNVTTFAGNGTPASIDGTGGRNGTAEFRLPAGIALDGRGYLYVADYYGESIRRVDPLGNVTTLAGTSAPGYVDGPAAMAEFCQPSAVAVDVLGNVYVTDLFNNRIRLIHP